MSCNAGTAEGRQIHTKKVHRSVERGRDQVLKPSGTLVAERTRELAREPSQRLRVRAEPRHLRRADGRAAHRVGLAQTQPHGLPEEFDLQRAQRPRENVREEFERVDVNRALDRVRDGADVVHRVHHEPVHEGLDLSSVVPEVRGDFKRGEVWRFHRAALLVSAAAGDV
eukprot:31049-Pelagococcus_subviridis.AAC.15